MSTNSQYKYFIGVDPGVSTGICVWSKWDKRIRQLGTIKIHQAMETVKYWHSTNPGQVKVRVEDARKAKFNRQQEMYKAQGAGSVMRDAKIWEDFLADLQIDYEMVRPKKDLTKWNSETFKNITGYAGASSEHARDAALLVYGF